MPEELNQQPTYFNIPPSTTRRWSGVYQGNYYGTLFRTHGVDFDRSEGKVALSRRLTKVTDTTDTNTDTLGAIKAFIQSDASGSSRWWALSDCGASGIKALYYTIGDSLTDPTSSWSVDTISGSPTNCRDFTVFENDTRGDSANKNQLFVSLDSDIAVLNDTGNNDWKTNWWSSKEGHTGDSGLDTGVPHPIQYFPFRRLVLLGSKNKVHTISRPTDTQNDTSTVNRLLFPKELETRHIFHTSTRAWILCKNLYGGNGKVVEWDGFSESYNEIYDALSTTPLAGVNYKETPIIVNNRGMILEFNGAGFAPMVRNGQVISLPVAEEPSGQITDIAPRGMTVGEDGLIYINVRHGGVTGAAGTSSHKQNSGIWCLNPISGRLYTKHALGGWDSLGDGAQRVGDVGAIHALNPSQSTRGFLVGGSYLSTATVSKHAIWTLEAPTSSTAAKGYFITQFIPATEIRDFWDSMWLRFQRFATATNRIVVKAKGVTSLKNASYEPLDKTITWTSTTTFNMNTSATDDEVAVGDEVEILGGDNAGTLAHITSISGVHGGAQDITIDETVNSSSATALARFDRWKKCGTITTASKYESSVNVGVRASFVQFKIELRGPFREMELENLSVNFTPDLYTKR